MSLCIVNLLIESSVIAILARWEKQAPRTSLILTCAAANLVTYPIAFLAWEYSLCAYPMIELLVIVTELMIYRCTLDCQMRIAVTLAGVSTGITLLFSVWVSI